MDAVEGAAVGGGDFGADAILEGGGVVTEGNLFGHTALGFCTWLDEDIAIFLAAASTTDVGLGEA